MNEIEYKTFLLGKENESDGRQDALAVNDLSLMFAIADGVSNSFHPEIVARYMCSSFVNENPKVIFNWPEFSNETWLPNLSKVWHEKIETYFEALSGRILRHEKINFERYSKVGASTFCGIHINKENDKLYYVIIGDSTLFISKCDGTYLELNSCPKKVIESGQEITDYSNATSAVLSNNTICGEWIAGELQISEIQTIALMSDGAAQWYQKRVIDNQDPFNTLWQVANMEEFSELANNARSNGEMDDDLAVILIKIKDSVTEESAPTLVVLTDNPDIENKEEITCISIESPDAENEEESIEKESIQEIDGEENIEISEIETDVLETDTVTEQTKEIEQQTTSQFNFKKFTMICLNRLKKKFSKTQANSPMEDNNYTDLEENKESED